MEKITLVINGGSSSKKYVLFEGTKEIFHLNLDSVAMRAIRRYKQKSDEIDIEKEQFENGVGFLLEHLEGLEYLDKVSLIAVRIVCPGDYFTEDKIIDAAFIKKLQEYACYAPLHAQTALEEIKMLKKYLPEVTLVSISDSTFYNDIPALAAAYPLPHTVTKKYGVRRFGYHGIACGSIVRKLKNNEKFLKSSIVCHLGGGVSIIALKNGKPVDMSMGFSPLEGVMMTTRSGSLDPALVIYLQKKMGFNGDELVQFLNSESGLKGLAGAASDVRDLLPLEKKGDAAAKMALDLFTYEIAKQIGAYITILGSCSMIVFADGIGEYHPEIRARICAYLKIFGVCFDKEKNNKLVHQDGFFEERRSLVKLAVVVAQEAQEMVLRASLV